MPVAGIDSLSGFNRSAFKPAKGTPNGIETVVSTRGKNLVGRRRASTQHEAFGIDEIRTGSLLRFDPAGLCAADPAAGFGIKKRERLVAFRYHGNPRGRRDRNQGVVDANLPITGEFDPRRFEAQQQQQSEHGDSLHSKTRCCGAPGFKSDKFVKRTTSWRPSWPREPTSWPELSAPVLERASPSASRCQLQA